MTIEKEIQELLEQNFLPTHLSIINESDKHHGHAGDDGSGQTHFKVRIAAQKFKGLKRIEQHKAVMDCLKPLFARGLHALALEINAID
ncbi:MAG: BolA family transcriptional regulator [Alphaproteobacteria bacterium]|nr:BolA family transcriptional regulator [Alphaproteobacteria bacterium]